MAKELKPKFNDNWNQPLSIDAYTHQKKQKQISNWYKQYGVVVQNDEQYNFFKANRAIILKALPLVKEIKIHFPNLLEDGIPP